MKRVDNVTQRADKLTTKKWWNHFFLRLISVLMIVMFTVSVLGVLAIPIVMSFFYSPLWIFLYAAYLMIILLFTIKD